jgi:uncharacterized protein (DUF433 family)
MSRKNMGSSIEEAQNRAIQGVVAWQFPRAMKEGGISKQPEAGDPPLLDSKRKNGRRAMFDRITYDPEVMGGKACLRGMRITLSLVVNLVANGMMLEEIRVEYPDLEAEDIRQALGYAAALANDEIHPLASPAA